MTFDEQQLQTIALEARAHLVERFETWKRSRGFPVGPDSPPTRDMCRAAAAAIAIILTEYTGWEWSVDGGWHQPIAPELPFADSYNALIGPGGILDSTGKWRGHYWATSVCDPDDPEAPGTIVDISADQFGLPEVIVSVDGDLRFRSNLDPMAMEEELGDGAWTWARRWADEFLARAIHDDPRAGSVR